MKKVWRVILVIVVISIAVGAVSAGVGVLTGADFERIGAVFEDRVAEQYNVINKGCMTCPIKCARTVRVDGRQVKAKVFTYTIMIEDLKHYSLAEAKTRFEALLAKIQSKYGTGRFTSKSPDFKVYEIKYQGGVVSVMLTNEDEMYGKSSLYVVGIGFHK